MVEDLDSIFQMTSFLVQKHWHSGKLRIAHKMKKRNNNYSINATNCPPLPVTQADRSDDKRRGKRRQSLTPIQAFVALILAILLCGVLVVVAQRSAFGEFSSDVEEPSRQLISKERNLPLADFPSVQYALRNSEITLLYFAAAWCRMSTPVTERIDATFKDLLLVPPDEDTPRGDLLHRHPLSLVYVSSDQNEQEMKEYLRTNWMYVPFHSEEREALKRRFATCARRELAELGMERKHEIPTLIVLSSRTHNVLTFHGAKDVEEYGVDAIDHWLDLEHLSQALSEKYA